MSDSVDRIMAMDFSTNPPTDSPKYAPNDTTNRPFRQQMRLANIFTKMEPTARAKWGAVRACDAVVHGRQSDNPLLGMILMACAAEQVKFLCAVYDDMHPDKDVLSAFASLIKTGRFIDVMDHKDPEHRKLVLVAYSAVMEARGKL